MKHESAPRDVTIYSLEMRDPSSAQQPENLSGNVRLERAVHPTPELARWLYGAVGGPWRWNERLSWTYQQWADELSDQGSELWLLYLDGTPAGYCQLAAGVKTEGGLHTETEILYFGLMPWVIGRGLGKPFLQHMVSHAWNLGERHALPAVSRVWVHTCSLDGPYALANYQKRGLSLFKEETVTEIHVLEPLTSWEAQFEH